jgi:hypothetical protein
MLKPGGSLILAIENKLGLKYFAGASEDHVGIPMFGLENRYTANSVRTFGRIELEKLLSQAGFNSSQFNSPLPDYKLTTSVISESGFLDEHFDSAALVIDSFTADPQLPSTLAFVPEMVIDSISENGLGLNLSNSYLVIAGKKSQPLVEENYLAWHFSTNRRKPYCMKTEFIKTSTNQIKVKKTKLSDLTSRGLLAHNYSEEVEYIKGRKLSFELMRVLSLNGWKHSDLASIFNKFYAYLLQFKVNPGQSDLPIYLEKELVDLIPKNIVVDASESMHFFDLEWQSNTSIDVRHVLFRSILQLSNLSIVAPDENSKIHSVKSLFFLVCDLLKIECSNGLFEEFSQTCVEYQREISDYAGSIDDFSNVTSNSFVRAKFDPNLRNQIDLERDSVIAERDSVIAERDSVIAERDSVIAERDSVTNSKTWKLFAIYRKFRA